MRSTVSKLGRHLLWPASLLTLGVGTCLIGRGTPPVSIQAQSGVAQVGATQSSALSGDLQATNYPNVTRRFEPSADGNSRLISGAGLIYGKPGSVPPRASYSSPVTEHRGASVAGGYYITLPASRFPRATAHVRHSGKVFITCDEPSSTLHHDHKVSGRRASLR